MSPLGLLVWLVLSVVFAGGWIVGRLTARRNPFSDG